MSIELVKQEKKMGGGAINNEKYESGVKESHEMAQSLKKNRGGNI